MQLPTNLSPVHLAVIVPVILILARSAYIHARRLFGGRSMSGSSYVVKWGKERLTFPLPSPDTKLGVIRQQLADYTQLPLHSFKLVHAGAVMKDDTAPISAYAINAKSRIAIIGGGDNSVSPSKTAPERRTQESTITHIRDELEKVRKTLQPDVDQFLASLGAEKTEDAPSASPHSAFRTASPGLGKQSDLSLHHARLGEMLLQSLLRLDAVIADGEWEEARKERKGAVKEVQSLLDRLDRGWRARTKS